MTRNNIPLFSNNYGFDTLDYVCGGNVLHSHNFGRYNNFDRQEWRVVKVNIYTGGFGSLVKSIVPAGAFKDYNKHKNQRNFRRFINQVITLSDVLVKELPYISTDEIR